MALAAGNTATWSDVSGIYSRVVSERNRWGRSTSVSGSGAGSTIMTAHGQSLRNAMVDLVNNISYLSGFKSSVTGTANITQGSLISVPTLTTLRSALNGMRTVFGYIGTGAHMEQVLVDSKLHLVIVIQGITLYGRSLMVDVLDTLVTMYLVLRLKMMLITIVLTVLLDIIIAAHIVRLVIVQVISMQHFKEL